MTQTAIVVGGTRRVGRWVSEALLVEGHRVYAIYRHRHQPAQECAEAMAKAGYALHTLQADVTNAEEASLQIGAIAQEEGDLGIVVYCAGPASSTAILATPSDDFEALWRANVLGVHNVVRAAVPYLRLKGGRLVLFLSVGADTLRAYRDVPVYGACKTMLASYARSLARELAGDNITVNCIALGVTPLAPESVPQLAAEQLPTSRYVTQEDVAAAIWYLTGPHSAQLTGTVLNLSGGFAL